MSLLKLKYLALMPNPASILQNVAIATGETLLTWLGKFQGQINYRPMVYMQSSSPIANPQEVCMTLQTAANGTLTVTFSKAFKTGTIPNVQLTAMSTLTTQPTVVELTNTPTATGCVIKSYRTRTQGVLLGGTINPTQEEQAWIMIRAIGEAP